MQLMDDALYGLWRQNKVELEDLVMKAQNPDELRARVAKAMSGVFDDDEDVARRARDGADSGGKDANGKK